MWSWLKQFFWWKCTEHEWERLTAGGEIYRSCVHCDRIEKLNPHSGEWTFIHKF